MQDYINSPICDPNKTLEYYLNLGYNNSPKWSSTYEDTLPNRKMKELFGQSNCLKICQLIGKKIKKILIINKLITV